MSSLSLSEGLATGTYLSFPDSMSRGPLLPTSDASLGVSRRTEKISSTDSFLSHLLIYSLYEEQMLRHLS